jgi:hypothetical protein
MLTVRALHLLDLGPAEASLVITVLGVALRAGDDQPVFLRRRITSMISAISGRVPGRQVGREE